jgi:hypothetical protein
MRRLIVAAAMAGAMALGGAAVPAAAVTVGDTQGCTPGFWKNHEEDWQETDPYAEFTTTFANAALYTSLADITNKEALQMPGGPGTEGAARILARAAMAAWLNAAHDDVAFPWRRPAPSEFRSPGLVKAVNDAFASGDRAAMLELASQLDADNNLGCPL